MTSLYADHQINISVSGARALNIADAEDVHGAVEVIIRDSMFTFISGDGDKGTADYYSTDLD